VLHIILVITDAFNYKFSFFDSVGDFLKIQTVCTGHELEDPGIFEIHVYMYR